MTRNEIKRIGLRAAVLLFWPLGAMAGNGAEEAGSGWLANLTSIQALGPLQPVIVGVLILFAGWVIAKLASFLVYWSLCRTNIDNKLVNKLGIHLLLDRKGAPKQEQAVERFVARVVYYLLMLFVVIAVLDFAGFTQAAGPIQDFVGTIVTALPLIGKAGLILVIAYFAAVILRRVVTGALGQAKFDERFAEMSATETVVQEGEEAPRPFSQAAGAVIFWLVLLIGLAGAFEALEIGAIAVPLRGALDKAVMLLPAVGTAALILFVGYVLARIAKAIVSNLLRSVGVDGLSDRLKIQRVLGQRRASEFLGLVAFVFILLQATVLALEQLSLLSLSSSLTGMMDQFWSLLPSLLVSIVILLVGLLVARIARSVVENLLDGLGFDALLGRMGVRVGQTDAPTESKRRDTPSRIVGFIVQLAITLLAVAQVLENLNLTVWADLVGQALLFILSNVLVALLILGIGVALGNYVRDLVRSRSEQGQAVAGWIGDAARGAVLVFAFTMALQQLGVASDFVLLSFALLFGGLCLALALAFGLGSREVAGDIVRRQYQQRGGGQEPPSSDTSRSGQ